MSKHACKDCPDRKVLCHAECERYAKRKEEEAQERAERHKEVAVICYQCDQKMRYIKDKRNHKLFKKEIRDK